jgi:hypothetical protein
VDIFAPSPNQTHVQAQDVDPLDLFGSGFGTGASGSGITTKVPPGKTAGAGGLSAQDLSFFEGL